MAGTSQRVETAQTGRSTQINMKTISAAQASGERHLFIFDTQPFSAIFRIYYLFV